MDDSGLSFSETSSGTSTPITTDIQVCDDEENTNIVSPVLNNKLHDIHPNYHQHHAAATHQEMFLQQFRDSLQPAWVDFAFSYLNRAVPYLPLYHQQIPLQPQIQFFNGSCSPSSVYNEQQFTQSGGYNTGPYFENVSKQRQPASSNNNSKLSANTNTIKPPKKCGFTISAILGCES